MERRLAVVTGASSGIGAAVSGRLRLEGFEVAGMARRPCPDADRSFSVDIGDARSVARAFAQLGTPAVLVHTAATIHPVAPFVECDPEAWVENVRVNLLGTFYVLRTAVPGMVAAGTGTAIHLTSGAASRAKPWWSAYSSAKAGAEHLVRSIASDIEGTGVAVCALDPGITDTPMQESIRAMRFPGSERYVDIHGAGGARLPSEVADAVATLLGRGPGELNGRTFRVGSL